MKKYTDEQKVELLNWFEDNGEGAAIVSDDRGNWACSGTGFQNIEAGSAPIDISTNFYIESKDWKESIWEAIEYYKDND